MGRHGALDPSVAEPRIQQPTDPQRLLVPDSVRTALQTSRATKAGGGMDQRWRVRGLQGPSPGM